MVRLLSINVNSETNAQGKPNEVKMVRASITFQASAYRKLEGIAEEKGVSLAWVVREAVRQYLDGKWPLFRGDE